MAALLEYNILDTPREAAFDRITALAADLFDAPIAVVSLIDTDRQWFKSVIGLDATQTPRAYAFCDHTIRSDEVMVVPDALLDERFRANPLVLGDPLVRFYAGAPLRLRSGLRLGSLCIIDREPRSALSDVEKRRLQTLAQMVVDEMDLRLTGERLSLARRHAEAATEAKSEFLANMSHELRTPLTSIIGFAGILGASAALGDKERGYADKIQSASRNLLAIVNDVLDLAHLDAGNHERSTEMVDLLALSTAVMELVAEQAAGKGLSLVLEASEVLPMALADSARLRQVLLNLLGNAVKFTDAGEVRLSLYPAEEPGSVIVAVRDTGIGIPSDRMDQVFERFVQADNSISRRFGGTGLGLAISRRLLERMDGEITVTSTLGEGSTFRVRVPAAAKADPDLGPTAASVH